MYNVIINGNDYSMANTILNQIKNLKNSMPDANIEVVFNRSAVKTLLKGSEFIPKVKEIIDSGVKILPKAEILKEFRHNKYKLDKINENVPDCKESSIYIQGLFS